MDWRSGKRRIRRAAVDEFGKIATQLGDAGPVVRKAKSELQIGKKQRKLLAVIINKN